MRRTIALVLILVAAVSVDASKRRAAAPGGRCSPGGWLSPLFSDIEGVAIDATHVYFFDDFPMNAIQRIPKGGGEPETLALLPSQEGFTTLTVDDTSVYYMTFQVPPGIPSTLPPSNLYSVPKTGGTPVLLTTDVRFPFMLQTDATHIYWASLGTVSLSGGVASDGKIERMAKNGTARLALADDLSAPTALVLDGGDVIFNETGLARDDLSTGIRRVPKDGGPITDVRDGVIAFTLAAAGNDLYFAGGDTASAVFGILHMPKTGGTPAVILDDESISAGPIVHDGQLYYVTEDEDEETFLRAVPATGGASRLLAKGPIDTEAMAVDDCYVYYTALGTLLYVRR